MQCKGTVEALQQKGGWSWGCAPLSLPVSPHLGGREIKSTRASNFVLMFHKDLEFFRLSHRKRSLKHIFSLLECMEYFSRHWTAAQAFFPVSHMHLVRCQFSICGLKTTSVFSFACATVIYVSKLKHKGYPPPVACTGQATGGPEWWSLLFLDVRNCYCRKQWKKNLLYYSWHFKIKGLKRLTFGTDLHATLCLSWLFENVFNLNLMHFQLFLNFLTFVFFHPPQTFPAEG